MSTGLPSLNVPDEAAAYDSPVRPDCEVDFDAILMENVNARSFLWQYLQGSANRPPRVLFLHQEATVSHS